FGTLLSLRIRGLDDSAIDEFICLSGIDFSEKAKQRIKEMTGMLPLYLQAFFHVAKGMGLEKIGEEELKSIKEEVFDMLNTHFDYYFQELRGFKRSVMIEMALEGFHTAAALSGILEKPNNYVTTYLRRLENEGFLEHLPGGRYDFTDPFFKLWIKEHTA
ncbi:MAG: hypothetical protein KAT70_08300, partial [Thermoplasmata archaeon]|nr:hypothetical protein [Thermoplasmata archaeon]